MTSEPGAPAGTNRGGSSPRVALVDDDRKFALACCRELALAGFHCAHFKSTRAVLGALDRGQSFSVLMMDLMLKDEDPYAAIGRLQLADQPPAIVVITRSGLDHGVFMAFRAGAVGYVLKDDARGHLAEVLGEVARGGAPMSPCIARRVVNAFRTHEPDSRLTAREIDVLRLLARGMSYGDVAGSLDLSLDTVRSHVRKIYDKLQVANKTEAVARAMRIGILT